MGRGRRCIARRAPFWQCMRAARRADGRTCVTTTRYHCVLTTRAGGLGWAARWGREGGGGAGVWDPWHYVVPSIALFSISCSKPSRPGPGGSYRGSRHSLRTRTLYVGQQSHSPVLACLEEILPVQCFTHRLSISQCLVLAVNGMLVRYILEYYLCVLRRRMHLTRDRGHGRQDSSRYVPLQLCAQHSHDRQHGPWPGWDGRNIPAVCTYSSSSMHTRTRTAAICADG